jgi:hypothetical protein
LPVSIDAAIKSGSFYEATRHQVTKRTDGDEKGLWLLADDAGRNCEALSF